MSQVYDGGGSDLSSPNEFISLPEPTDLTRLYASHLRLLVHWGDRGTLGCRLLAVREIRPTNSDTKS